MLPIKHGNINESRNSIQNSNLMLGSQVTNQKRSSKQERGIKENLFSQELTRLKTLDEYCSNLLNDLTTALREKQFIQLAKLEDKLCFLSQTVNQENSFFQQFVRYRPFQKHNENTLFRTILKNYEDMKNKLSRDLFNLQNNIQQLESNGLQIFSENPPKNSIIDEITEQRLTLYLNLQEKYGLIAKLFQREDQVTRDRLKLAHFLKKKAKQLQKRLLKEELEKVSEQNKVLKKAIDLYQQSIHITKLQNNLKNDKHLSRTQLRQYWKKMKAQIEELKPVCNHKNVRSFSCKPLLKASSSIFQSQESEDDGIFIDSCKRMFV